MVEGFETRVLPTGDGSGVSTVPAPAPTPATGTPAASPATGGGYDDAMKKLGLTPTPTPTPTTPEQTPKEEVEAMIDNLSGIQNVIFSIKCMAGGIEKTAEIEKHLNMTESEKRQLKNWGPSVLPYWKQLGLDKNVGPIFFLASLAQIETEHWKGLQKAVEVQRAETKIKEEKKAAELAHQAALTKEAEEKAKKVLRRTRK